MVLSKRVKWAIAGTGAALVLVVFLAMFLAKKLEEAPRSWQVSASVEIAAARERIRPLIENPKRWSGWSAWARDTRAELTRDFSGPESGEGAQVTWRGPQVWSIELGSRPGVRREQGSEDIADGTLVIRAARPDAIEVQTVFEDRLVFSRTRSGASLMSSVTLDSPGTEFVVLGTIHLEEMGGGTRVTWIEEVDIGQGFSAGMFALTLGGKARSLHQAILAESLQNLKRLLERRAGALLNRAGRGWARVPIAPGGDSGGPR